MGCALNAVNAKKEKEKEKGKEGRKERAKESRTSSLHTISYHISRQKEKP